MREFSLKNQIKMALKTFFLLSVSSAALAEVGVVNPADWGAQFKADEISKAIFCVKKSSDMANDQHCATAFLVSEKGHLLTAHHVEDLPRDHADIFQEKRTFPASQVLVDQLNQSYEYEVVAYPSYQEINVPFLSDPQKVMMDEFLQMSRGGGFNQPSISQDIAPENYTKMDAIVLKIKDQDLKKLKALNVRPLSLRKESMKKGERLFVVGYPWTHYNPSFFDMMKGAIQQKNPNRPELQAHNGELSFMTGLFDHYQDNSVVTSARKEQVKDLSLDSDAIDTGAGASGSPVIDSQGQVVGVHWASDSSSGRFAPLKRSLITFAVDARKVSQRLRLKDLLK